VVGSSVDDDKVLLVVAKDADESDIIIAFQKIALKNHPDNDADAANAFRWS
jgi:DnaJ-class molecular chaperone